MKKQKSTEVIKHYDELFTLFYDEVLRDLLKGLEVDSDKSLEFDFTKEDDLRRFFINEVCLLNSSNNDSIHLVNFTKEFLLFHSLLIFQTKSMWKFNMFRNVAEIIVQHFYNTMDDMGKPINSYYTPNPEKVIYETSFYEKTK